MRPRCFTLTAVVLCCVAGGNEAHAQYREGSILERYTGNGPFTDPGEYARLYADLPASLADLCARIKAQLMHPDADLPRYRDILPPGRMREDEQFPTVRSMLAGLEAFDARGLTAGRAPEHRLILSCRYHAILLASILRHRGIPVRVRYGFARYLHPNPAYRMYHVVCEVWNRTERRWMLVDPDRQLVDFPRERFELAGEVWLRYVRGELNASNHGAPGWWGAHPILSVLCHDLASVLGNEYEYWVHPPLCRDADMDVAEIPQDRRDVLNRVARLLSQPDASLRTLQRIYIAYGYLRFPV